MAGVENAAGFDGGGCRLPHVQRLLRVIAAVLIAIASNATPAFAASNVRITALTDLAFSTIANVSVDSSRSESVCVYSTSPTSGYHVTATGTGIGGAFTLASGANRLAYDVQWNRQPGQSSGTQLTAGVPLTGLVSSATQQQCTSGPTTSASLIVVLRSAALSAARAGIYTGTLTLLIAPE